MRGMVGGTPTRLLVVAAALVATALPSTAAASQLIDRNATAVRLAVNQKGEAMITYRTGGRLNRVLVWGAVNARFPSATSRQVRLKKDYAGGWGKYRRLYWRGFRNVCRRYDGPALAWFVTGCKAPDGSYWALQSWQTPLPDLGYVPWLPMQRAWELHVSHWTGPLAKLEVHTDWIYGGRFHDLFGRLTYLGHPVFGYHTTRYGAPTDGFGRLLYLDTFDSAYGRGWRRENSFVAHNPTGMFCYGFYPFDPTKNGYAHPPGQTGKRGPGNGLRYRITVEGPGVTPDVTWTGPGLHDYDAHNPADVLYEHQQNALLDSMIGVDRQCRQH
jgi:hypothetical protein